MSQPSSSHAAVVLDRLSLTWPDGTVALDGVSGAFGAGRTGAGAAGALAGSSWARRGCAPSQSAENRRAAAAEAEPRRRTVFMAFQFSERNCIRR